MMSNHSAETCPLPLQHHARAALDTNEFKFRFGSFAPLDYRKLLVFLLIFLEHSTLSEGPAASKSGKTHMPRQTNQSCLPGA